MTAPAKTQAVVRTEPAAIAYPLRSPVADILTKQEARAAIEPMLRPGDSYERIVVEVFHAAANNPDILKCTPQSIVSAVAKAVGTGLVISEGIHLVPYGQKLQAIFDYKGRVELIVRAGVARAIDAHCVYANERFDYTQGTNPTIEHHPIMDPTKRGAMIGAYAIATLNHYRSQSVVLSTAEIEQVRQQYSKQWKSGELPYWYAQKTCVHRLAKLLPRNPALAQVIALFEREERDLEEAEPGLEPGQRIDPVASPAAGSDPLADQAPQNQEPAAASNGDHTVAWALAYPFPFQKGKATHGRPMGEFSTEHLVSTGEWIVAQQKTKGDETWHNDTLHAVHLILSDREKADETHAAKLAADDADDGLPF